MVKFRNKFHFLSQLVLLGAVMAAIPGCGEAEAPDERPERVLFGGTAKLNGAAVVDALITFHPVGAKGNGASGKTDSKGNFVMSTFEAGDGVVPGDYKVTAIKSVSEAGGAEVSDEDPNYDGGPTEEEEEAASQNLLPPKFEDPETSGVTVSVKEANQEFLLEFK